MTATSPVRTNVPAISVAPQARGKGRRWVVAVIAVIVLAGLAAVAGVMNGVLPNPRDLARPAADPAIAPKDSIPTVKVIHPKHESSVPITVEQIATVEPFFRADLRARVAGIVKSVRYDIGDRVRAGEVLVVIDVPELEQDVARAESMIVQREKEKLVSIARLKDAKAARDVSAATIRQREADVQAAEATRDLKKRKFARFQDLAAKGSVVGSVVEEEERDYLASEAGVTASKANVERAKADFAESESKIEAAMADIELKSAQIDVARKERDRAQALADSRNVVAPFDGVVVRRTVDPGSFVTNATSGNSEALISIAKVDVVTISARFPDSVAPSIVTRTPAQVTFDDMPGVAIAAKVTRFAPSVQNADRTMRIEVDVFNGDRKEWLAWSDSVKKGLLQATAKGASDPELECAFPEGASVARRLIPGMSGSMKLTIGGFGTSYVLPSTAVYSRSGTSYLLLVRDGLTHQVPVKVQVNDGKTVRLAMLERAAGRDGIRREQLMELTGQELVVLSRQLEIGEGVRVNAGLSDW